MRRGPKAHIFSTGCLIRDGGFGREDGSGGEWKEGREGPHEGVVGAGGGGGRREAEAGQSPCPRARGGMGVNGGLMGA